ncbi:lantibiotic dehydratase [Streptomyces sp. NPDC127068]|uniref:lantibiotic dehydratase n=1 Tax=Streptomyces sp. NPDC127068 TaxID=3347127 RepID=UPI00365859CE
MPATPSTWVPADFFVLRTPLLPLDALLSLGDGLEAPGCTDPADLDAALTRDRLRVRERLRRLYARPDVAEALAVASPSLARALERWQRDADSARGRKVERSLLRYLARMAARPTPFGLFAGCSTGVTGAAGEPTELRLAPARQYRRHTRLDCRYLTALCDVLQRDPQVRRSLRYVPNSSLYGAPGGHRYAEARTTDRGRSYALVTVAGQEPLDRALARAARGGARPVELAAAVRAGAPTATPGEALAYIRELMDHQVITPVLEPSVSGSEPMRAVHSLLTELRGCPPAERAAGALARVTDQLHALDLRPPGGTDRAAYRRAVDALAALPVEAERTGLFRVDLVKPTVAATLGGEVLDEIGRGAHLLHQVSGRRPSPSLDLFREAFRERYGRREVPLCEALDPEAGIGFPAAPGGGAGAPSGARDALLLEWLGSALRTGADEIALGAEEQRALAAATDRPPPLPDAFGVLATVLAGTAQEVARGRFRVLIAGVSGPSGANLLGRFCHGEGPLRERVRAHLRAEEALRPDAVFAEVVHLPEGRIGNVLARPRLRDHEIPYLGRSTASPGRQIPVTDLLVSVIGDRVVLRSARLGREVVPRVTTAHDHRGAENLGTYRFLCALQHQGRSSGLSFSFGALAGAPFLPRVTAGRLVLSRARWNLSPRVLGALGGPSDGRRLRTAVRELRATLRLPRRVAVAEGDQLLPVDLDDGLSVEVFASLVRNRARVTLVESFHGPDEVFVSGPEGRFVHELVVPFVRSPVPAPPALPAPPPPRPARSVAPVRRCFHPGSEWLHAQLYTGAATADSVLRELVGPLLRRFLAEGAVDDWFFVRYADPDWHLRLRLHGAPGRLLGEVLPALHDGIVRPRADGTVRRLRIDGYEREVERFGGAAGIVLAERLFRADSEAALRLVATVPHHDRWRTALLGVDRLLTDFGLDLAGKRAVVGAAREQLGAEHPLDPQARRRLDSRYRAERAQLTALLSSSRPRTAVDSVFAARSAAFGPVVAELRTAARAGRLTRPLPVLAGTLTHLHANRVLRTASRSQELALHGFLCRLYDSAPFLNRGAEPCRPSPAGERG